MRYEDIDLELLRCFVIVAETKSFTEAGHRLGRTQSAITIRIHKLEALFEATLLVRNSRRVSLTERGELLLPKARALLALGEETIAAIRTPVLSGKLRIGFLEYLAPHRIPEILANIKRSLPDADLQFRIGLSGALLHLLDRGEIDVAVAMHYPTRLDAIPFAKDPLVWMETARGDQASVDKDLPLCLLDAPCFYRTAAVEALDQAGRSHQEIITANSVHAVRSAVASGLGLTVLGTSSAGGDLKIASNAQDLPALPEMMISVYGADERKKLFAKILGDILSEYVTVL